MTGVTLRRSLARSLDLPTVSLSREEASTHYISPFMGMIYGADAPVSSIRTQQLLGWTPTHEGLLRDLEHGDYLTALVA